MDFPGNLVPSKIPREDSIVGQLLDKLYRTVRSDFC